MPSRNCTSRMMAKNRPAFTSPGVQSRLPNQPAHARTTAHSPTKMTTQRSSECKTISGEYTAPPGALIVLRSGATTATDVRQDEEDGISDRAASARSGSRLDAPQPCERDLLGAANGDYLLLNALPV